MIRKLKSGKYRLYSRKKDPPDRQTKKSRHLQQQGGSEETRTRGSVFQTALGRSKNIVAPAACVRLSHHGYSKAERPFAGLINLACPSLYCVVMVQVRFFLRCALW